MALADVRRRGEEVVEEPTFNMQDLIAALERNPEDETAMSEDEQNRLLDTQKRASALIEEPLMLLNSGNAAGARTALI